jgi:hypothetical protein
MVFGHPVPVIPEFVRENRLSGRARESLADRGSDTNAGQIVNGLSQDVVAVLHERRRYGRSRRSGRPCQWMGKTRHSSSSR